MSSVPSIDALLFEASRVDDQWLGAFERLIDESPGWVDACAAVVARVYSADPAARDGYSRMALVCAAHQMPDQAVRWFEADASCGRMRRWQFLRYVEALLARDSLEPASQLVERYYAAHPDAIDGWATIAAHQLKIGDFAGAVALYDRDLALGRLSGAAMSRFAEAEARLGHWVRAMAILAEHTPVGPMPTEAYARLGWIRFNQGHHAEAVALFDRDYEKGRLATRWKEKFCLALGTVGAFDRAASLVEQCYAADASLQNLYARLGWLKHDASDWAGAVALMERDEQVGRLSQPWLWRLAQAVARTGDVARAIGLTAQVYEHDATLMDGFARLADLSAAAGNAEVALDLLRRDAACERLSPKRREALSRRLVRLGRVTEAVEVMHALVEQSARVYPDVTDDDIQRALVSAGDIRDRIVGRAVGDIGDNLAQYGAIAQLVNRGCPRPIRFLEIGTLFGGSCLQMLHACRDLNVEYQGVCIDPMTGYYARAEDQSRVPVTVDTLVRNLCRFGFTPDGVEVRQFKSQEPEAWRGLAEDSVDLVLIDGDHSFQGVTDDWHLYSRFVAAGGYVLFDDYGDEAWGDLTKAVSLICRNLPAGWQAAGVLGTTMILRRQPASPVNRAVEGCPS